MEKFTQEVKDSWIAALKSGKFKQGTGQLVMDYEHDVKRHCCLGVLGVIHPKLSVGNGRDVELNEENPYRFIDDNFPAEEGELPTSEKLWRANDSDECPGNYHNVIPLIEELEVQS